jgi:penicillin-binding protein 1A
MAEPAAPPIRRRPLARIVRWVAALGIVGLLALTGGYYWFSRDLPSAEALLAYEPPLPTHVLDADGNPIAVFARERRIYRNYSEMPPVLIRAFVAAEDKSFFTHGGIDFLGIAGAIPEYVSKIGTGERSRGASTITQQVAKNLIVGNEYSLTRKVKEAILARRIERSFTKQQILELYLNQIFLGRNSYGVEAASQAYFGHGIDKITLPEAAYLAILPKAPSTYDPVRQRDRAQSRRDYVLRRMQEDGYITAAERDSASATPLVTARFVDRTPDRRALDFVEEVRRWLIAKFGETAANGKNSVYAGGLWVRTTVVPQVQDAAEQALRDGLVRYDRLRGWRGATDHINPGGEWASRLRAVNLPVGYSDWRAAVVLSNNGGIRIGLEDGSEASLTGGDMAGRGGSAFTTLKPGDVIPVKAQNGAYALRQIPEVGGGLVVMDPRNGHVEAIVGGFDARRSQFNRATQALRQPGSSFKPVVYTTALMNGMTPASIIPDQPFCAFQSRALGTKCFKNFGGGYAGPQTMRWGVEQSRNLMTVRTAARIGMDKVTETARKLGVGDYPPNLAIALGAGDTTVMRMVSAYATLIENGRKVDPVIVEEVIDRHGKVLWRADQRPCAECNASDYGGEPMPRPPLARPQVIDGAAAYQMVHIMEGVIERGTATRLRVMERPLMGKTGTTNGPTNAWFVGGSPQMVAGVYLGYDKPRPLGGWVQGGNTAAPMWLDVAQVALKDEPKLPFTAPEGVRLVRIDRRSGKRVFAGWPDSNNDPKAPVIWEAFNAAEEPREVTRLARGGDNAGVRSRTDAGFLASQGGIY